MVDGDEHARHEQTLRLFKRRADDLFECELARNENALELGQKIHFNLVVSKTTGEQHVENVRLTIPPKEQVAYALTLIRPLTLTKDRLAWSKVLDALEISCTDHGGQSHARIEQLRHHWSVYPVRRMRIMIGSADSPSFEPEVDAWDNEIARKFLYGDLVHGDDNAELLDALGNQQVIFAASAMASDGFMLVNNTYQVMHDLRPDIAPDSAYFTQRAMSPSVQEETAS